MNTQLIKDLPVSDAGALAGVAWRHTDRRNMLGEPIHLPLYPSLQLSATGAAILKNSFKIKYLQIKMKGCAELAR